ncbi:hypothetical protein RMS17_000719, partial [Campylobacter coli]|nr:hypothetical protein [Campylobacter coli]
PLKCDLNSQDCTFLFKGKQILVSAYPKPIKIFKNTAIKVSNFPFDPNLKIKIYSLNSYSKHKRFNYYKFYRKKRYR